LRYSSIHPSWNGTWALIALLMPFSSQIKLRRLCSSRSLIRHSLLICSVLVGGEQCRRPRIFSACVKRMSYRGNSLLISWTKRPFGSIPSQQCNRHCGLCSVRHRHRRRVPAKSGFDPARMYGVHLDVGVLEFRCQMNREHVDCGLGGVVSELPQWCDGARVHCLKCQREARMLARLMILPASLFFSKGRNSRVRATRENRLMLKMLCNSSSVEFTRTQANEPICRPYASLKTVELNSGHLIFLEKPVELASAILSFCQ